MHKEFNVTGTCIPEKHYMADTSQKLKSIFKLIEKGKYFTINKPRQYGKTTTLYLLSRMLETKEDYIVIRVSFEEIDAPTYENQQIFINVLLDLFQENFEYLGEDVLEKLIQDYIAEISNMRELSKFITKLVRKAQRKVILMIDEVDKSSNNQLFLDFIGMLRKKYLMQMEGRDNTFHSVILAGVHDVKNSKQKLRDSNHEKFNSPWNIAVNFNIDMALNSGEIALMLKDYSKDKNIEMDINSIADKIYYYTSGYPFLVSKVCKIIDEDIINDEVFQWKLEYVDEAVKLILRDNNTNFESLIKNLENNKEIYNTVYNLLIEGVDITFNLDNPIINMGNTYGIFKNDNGKTKINNKIYEQRIYNYMISKIETKVDISGYNFRENFLLKDGSLDFEKILLKFQEFMRKEYSEKDTAFLEKNGRLIFLAFIKPIINGRGFDFKEVQISEEKRLDIVITYMNKQYVIELKIWHGE